MSVPTKISVDVNYYIDDEGSVIFDEEAMTEAFMRKLKELKPTPEYKNSITHTSFIRWFLSDDEDCKGLINSVREELATYGCSYVSVDKLFSQAGYIPQQICINSNGNEEYDPKEVKLITTIQ